MAVSEMEKLSIIGPIEYQEAVLKLIQGQRAVELTNATETFINGNLAQESIAEIEEQKEKDHKPLLKRLQEVSDFLKHHSSDKYQTVIKRREMTIGELESHYDEEELIKDLELVEGIKDRYEELGRLKEDVHIESDEFARWQYLDVIPKNSDLMESEMSIGVLNTENKEAFKEGLEKIPDLYQEEVYHSPHHIYYFLMYLKENTLELQQVIEKTGFKKVDYPYDVLPKVKYQELQKRDEEIYQERENLKKQLLPYAKKLDHYALAEEVLLAHIMRQEASDYVGETKDLFALEGWIPVEHKKEFLEALYEEIGNDSVVVEFSKPEKEDEIPIHLKNNPLVAPFELLTEMYSLPKYGEVDPTPLMTPFYLVFFGMMVADLGYGLIMFIGTLLAKKFFVLKRGMSRFVDFFFILSFPVMIWGLIYGSFFGAAMPEPFPLLSTSTDVTLILLLSVVFGFIQILFGLLINGVLSIKKKEYLNAIKDGFAWQGLLIGLVAALIGKMLLSSVGIYYTGLIVALLCAISIVVIPVVQSPSKGKGLAKGIYSLYGVTGYIGDLVSYTRLMALGISGGSIASAFNMLIGYMPAFARFTVGIILIIGLQLLNLFLSLLGAYVHGARLQFVEFFGKFFTGGGRAFNPLETQEKYVNIEKNKK